MEYSGDTNVELELAQSHTYEFVAGLELGHAIVDRVMASDVNLPAGRIFEYILARSFNSPERREMVLNDPIVKELVLRNDETKRAFDMGERLGIHDKLCKHFGRHYELREPEVVTPKPIELSERSKKDKPAE